MANVEHGLSLTDYAGDTLTVTANGSTIDLRTPRGTLVSLGHDDVQTLRRFLLAHLPVGG